MDSSYYPAVVVVIVFVSISLYLFFTDWYKYDKSISAKSDLFIESVGGGIIATFVILVGITLVSGAGGFLCVCVCGLYHLISNII